MSAPWQSNPAIPGPVREGLERLCSQLQGALGDSLVSVVLYGGLAKGEYIPGASNVNVTVVVREADVATLDRIAAPVQWGLQAFRLAAMVLTEEDLRTSTDAFPVKFQDLRRHHVVLYGKDVLAGLEISREHLRLRCEQEIRNLLFRLRQFYLLRSQFPEAVETTLTRAVSSLLASLAVLVELKTGQTPCGKDEIVEAAGKLGLDAKSLRDVLSVKRGDSKPAASGLRQLYDAFMKTVGQAAAMVDAL
jgi:predicted nucleotidyltransferase